MRANFERVIAALAGLSVALTGCATTAPGPRKPSVLEVRSFETREFDTKDPAAVLKAVMNVLQDDGYVIQQGNLELGIISAHKDGDFGAEKPAGENVRKTAAQNAATAAVVIGAVAIVAAVIIIATHSSGGGYHGHGPSFVPIPSSSAETPRESLVSIDCTANVSAHGQQTRVRMNFQRRILDERGDLLRAETVIDPAYYQEFFAKLDKGLFIEKEEI